MNKENPKKNKKSFEYYIAQRKEEFRCQYDHERSWENLQYKLQKRKNHRLSLYCVAASAAFLFLILGFGLNRVSEEDARVRGKIYVV